MPCARCRFALLLMVIALLSLSRNGGCAPAANWMWIWDSNPNRPPETLFFRQHFRLPRKPVNARLLITADDTFKAYLNQSKQPVAQGNDWTTVQEFDVTRFLNAGDNLLAVECQNTGGPGGLLYKLIMTLPGGKTALFFSDGRVRVNRRVPPQTWASFALSDAAWSPAKEIAPANGGTWGPLRGAPLPDTTHLIRLWDIRAGGKPDDDPYARPRNIGERMLLSASVSSASEMQILAGAGFTLFQSDSDHLSTEETAPNQWDWKTADTARRTVQRLGLDWSYFPHLAFPPPWYRNSVEFTRLQCLEHQQPVQAFSIWEPKWPGFIEHGYEAMAHAFGKAEGENNPKSKIQNPKPRGASALYVGIHGDYGEAGLMQGARVTVSGQKEDWERRFGNLHDHYGWWCHDPLARADFRKTMLQKYGSLERLNAAWKRAFKSPDEITYPQKPRGEARREWLDFVSWYQDSVGRAIEWNLSAARKQFPETLLMLPAGFGDEDPRGGNDNSLIPKIAARYKAEIRSTHSAFKPFAENAATLFGRLGSAARFYGVPFWAEPPSGLTPEQEVERLFEAVSQGAKGIFDWSSNAMASREVYYRYGKYLRVEKPIVDVAMFYPAMAQKLRPDQGFAPLFAQACAYLRDVTNFDIVDDRMVLDGCLANYRVLALWEGTLADPETLDKIKAWVSDGGVLLAYDFGKVTTFDGDASWFSEMFGYIQELAPARVTERYIGNLPAQYHIAVGAPEVTDYLGGEWYEPEIEGGLTRRWTGANASVRLPVDPEKRYTLVIRATVPPGLQDKGHKALVNGHEVGELGSPGDVTYRFLLSEDVLTGAPLSTLTFQSETFQFSKLNPESKDARRLGVQVQSVWLIEQSAKEAPDALPPTGTIRRELDLRLLKDHWARRYNKGLTIYFPANRQLLKGYIEVIRRAVYNLSAIYPGQRDALPIDNALDGVYATLFTDKILFYNPKDTEVTKMVTIPSETFAAWKGEVAIPAETSWKLTLEPHSIGAIYLAPPPKELLFECEKFTDLNGLRPTVDPTCSPGGGPTCVRLRAGTSISTRFLVDTPGRYALFTRCLRNGKQEPVEFLVDGQIMPVITAKAGQTLLTGTITLTRGSHTLTLRPRPGRDVRADFVLLTNDPNIAGYDFAIRTAPIE